MRTLEQQSRAFKEWYSKNKEKYFLKRNTPEYVAKEKTRYLSKKALKQGRFKKSPCFCGKVADIHHPDYSKPLEIIWLCKNHHSQLHNGSLVKNLDNLLIKATPLSTLCRVCHKNFEPKNLKCTLCSKECERISDGIARRKHYHSFKEGFWKAHPERYKKLRAYQNEKNRKKQAVEK